MLSSCRSGNFALTVGVTFGLNDAHVYRQLPFWLSKAKLRAFRWAFAGHVISALLGRRPWGGA